MSRTDRVSTPTAHLVGPGRLKVMNGHLAFSAPEQTPIRLDADGLKVLMCHGSVGMTGEAVELLLKRGVQVAWMTPKGRACWGRMTAGIDGGTALRMRQHAVFAGVEERGLLAVRVVEAKVASQVDAARHYQRQGATVAGTVLERLRGLQEKVAGTTDVSVLRGIEGAASAAWFEVLGGLLLEPWKFAKRVRRPPTDPVNALLSLGYTWLLNRTVARLAAAGLEVNLGALHEYMPGRPSLACDLMEPLRVGAVDRWVLALCNRAEVSPSQFEWVGGGMRLVPDVFPRVVTSWEGHWVGGGLDLELEGWVTGLARWLNGSPELPPGPKMPQETRGVQADSEQL
ncbi:MAG: CRISPR-associated endonuclease Cas1 [Planctomycetes bacterium]|nr:CRISPR-associated endonuclease Cas1 [Planctomycetota bacterium]